MQGSKSGAFGGVQTLASTDYESDTLTTANPHTQLMKAFRGYKMDVSNAEQPGLNLAGK